MDKPDVVDQERLLIEKLDQASNSLIASLHESKALNIQIQRALKSHEPTDVAEPLEPTPDLSAGLLQLLRSVIDGGKLA